MRLLHLVLAKLALGVLGAAGLWSAVHGHRALAVVAFALVAACYALVAWLLLAPVARRVRRRLWLCPHGYPRDECFCTVRRPRR